jgi:hypothetical protein
VKLNVDRINWKFVWVRAEILKARNNIFERGRKKYERRKRMGASQSKTREDHGNTKARRILFLSVSVSPWFKFLFCICVSHRSKTFVN